ncbi:hypothetical protein [Nonomuraea rubra]|uniref:hypothetical protein n=1 Tax=Nonomuraea rubra TaxID=46180 RepID=UPI0033C0E146
MIRPENVIREWVSNEVAGLRRAATMVGEVTGDAATRRRFERMIADTAEQLSAISPALDLDTNWATLAEAREKIDQLKTEALCYIQGMLYRTHRLDQGSGQAVDALIGYLTSAAQVPNGLVTGIAVGPESFTSTINLIRLPFPESSVWELPTVAHEAGHYVTRVLTRPPHDDRHPLMELIGDRKADASEPHLHEFVADAFATYTLGPSYPLTAMVLRIDPTEVNRPSPTHPAWRDRVLTMAQVLRELTLLLRTRTTEARSAGVYAALAEVVVRQWKRLTGDTDPEVEIAYVLAPHLAACLIDHAPHARYHPGPHLAALEGRLAGDDWTVPESITPAHVLHAAWMWRLRHPDDLKGREAVHRRARALLTQGGTP